MTDDERISEAHRRYSAALHGVQSAVRYEIEERGEPAAAADAKHLRVGVNSAFIETHAIVTLLLAKGVFSQLEYAEALAAAAEAELGEFETRHFPLTFR
jgi:hypothetical protein